MLCRWVTTVHLYPWWSRLWCLTDSSFSASRLVGNVNMMPSLTRIVWWSCNDNYGVGDGGKVAPASDIVMEDWLAVSVGPDKPAAQQWLTIGAMPVIKLTSQAQERMRERLESSANYSNSTLHFATTVNSSWSWSWRLHRLAGKLHKSDDQMLCSLVAQLAMQANSSPSMVVELTK